MSETFEQQLEPLRQIVEGNRDHEIRYLGDLQLLRIEPGDKFVLTFAGPVPQEEYQRIQDAWKNFAGDGVPLLVLEEGTRLGAIRTEPEDETHAILAQREPG